MQRVSDELSRVTVSGIGEREALIDMLEAVCAAVGEDAARRRALISALVNIAGISESEPGGIAPRAALRCLEQRGVIRRASMRHGGTRRYVLEGRFLGVRNSLMAMYCNPTRTAPRELAH